MKKISALESDSFLEQTKSFFDELSNIAEQQQEEREQEGYMTNDRPYSSMLTQDEEPVDDPNPHTVEQEEPEVVTRAWS